MKKTISIATMILALFFIISCGGKGGNDGGGSGNEEVSRPFANFYVLISQRSGEAPHTVNFQNRTIGEVNIYHWNLGGRFSNAINPSRTFYDPGVYTISLEAEGPDYSDTETKIGYIVVTEPKPETKTVTLSATEDTFIRSDGFPTSNYGDYLSLETGYHSLYYGNSITLIKFSLSKIPSGANVLSAKLVLTTAFDNTFYKSNGRVNVFQILEGNWSESTATYNNSFPSLSRYLTSNYEVPFEVSRVHRFEVKRAVSDWLNFTNPNYGFAVNTTNIKNGSGPDGDEGGANFYSRESSFNGGPRLEITYEE